MQARNAAVREDKSVRLLTVPHFEFTALETDAARQGYLKRKLERPVCGITGKGVRAAL